MNVDRRLRHQSVARPALIAVVLFGGVAFVLGQAGSGENESPKEAVTAFKTWRQATPHDEHSEAARRAWRDRLVRSAEADLSDAWAAMALYSAADLSSVLGEPDRARELYETIISDTSGDDTYKIFAHQALVSMEERACRSKWATDHSREDLIRVFEAYERCSEAILQLGPERLGPHYAHPLPGNPLRKARFLLSLHQQAKNTELTTGAPGVITPIPPCDPMTGLSPSGLVEEWFRARGRGATATGGQQVPADIYRILAQAYSAERKNAEAYDVYLRLLRSPDNVTSPLVALWVCEGLDPARGAQFRYHAEQFERRFADDPDRPSLSYAIAGSYLRDGVPQAFIDRMAPVLESARPEDGKWLEQPDVRATILSQLADAYEHPSVAEIDKAVAFLKEILDEHSEAPFVNDHFRSRYASLASRLAQERRSRSSSTATDESKASE